MTTIIVTIPASDWMSANQREHWAKKARKTRTIRTLGFLAARQTRLGTLPGKTHIHVDVAYPTARPADAPNAYPSVKATIDGFVDAGLLTGDTSDEVSLSFDRHPGKSPKGAYQLYCRLETLKENRS